MLETIWEQVAATAGVEWLGTATGLAAVWLSIRERAAAWPLFIVCYAAYAYFNATAGYPAAAGMNAVFIVLSIDGWRRWGDSTADTTAETTAETTAIESASGRELGGTTAVWLAISLGLGWLLARYTQGHLPYLDAAATTAGLVAQWLLSRKRVATWGFWLLSDLVFVGLYAHQGFWLTAGLFVVFTGLAIGGGLTWRSTVRAGATP